MRLPAVCSVEGAGVRLRRASLAGALAVDGVADPGRPVARPWPRPPGRPGPAPRRPHPGRTRPAPGSLPPPDGDDPRLRLLALTGALVAHDPPTVVHPADAAEAADVLLAFLVRHGYLGRRHRRASAEDAA